MVAGIIVLISIITILILEVKLIFDGKLEERLSMIPLLITILLPFWNQSLISVTPFVFLFICVLARTLIDIYEVKDRLNSIFWVLTVANIMILYFQLGFLIKNFLLTIVY